MSLTCYEEIRRVGRVRCPRGCDEVATEMLGGNCSVEFRLNAVVLCLSICLSVGLGHKSELYSTTSNCVAIKVIIKMFIS